MGMSAKAYIAQRHAIIDCLRGVLIALSVAIVCLEEEMRKPKVINLQAARSMRNSIAEFRRVKERLRESIATLLQLLHVIESQCAEIPEVEFRKDPNGKVDLWHPQLDSSRHGQLESL
jgi:hypothetical protein